MAFIKKYSSHITRRIAKFAETFEWECWQCQNVADPTTGM